MSDKQGPVLVPEYVAIALEEVRQEGLYNMFDRPGVILRMADLGHIQAAEWVTSHRDDYARFIIQGVRPMGGRSQAA